MMKNSFLKIKYPASKSVDKGPLIRLLLLLILVCCFFPGKAAAFNLPEKLVYDLTWAGLKAGTATMEIAKENGQTRIISVTRSAPWLSVFYEVDDRVESLLKNTETDPMPGLPENYHIRLK